MISIIYTEYCMMGRPIVAGITRISGVQSPPISANAVSPFSPGTPFLFSYLKTNQPSQSCRQIEECQKVRDFGQLTSSKMTGIDQVLG